MTFTAAQIAMMIRGSIEGNPEAQVTSFGKIEEAVSGQLSFLANPKYEEFLYRTEASIVIVNESQVLQSEVTATLIRVPDAYAAFATLLTTYQEMQAQQLTGIQEPVYMAPTAKIGEQVFIGAFTYIGEHVNIGNQVKIHPQVYIGRNVTIGDGTVLYPGVKIYHDTKIGKDVVIHAGTVIGSDGFGFAPKTDGTYQKVPQIGNVVIEDGVEIGANTTIDRATMGSTLIRAGVKLDNLIQIAHNVEIGTHTVIAAQTGISGSTKIGKNAMIGGQVGFAGHLHVADGTKITAQSGVTKTVKKPATTITGNPAMEISQSYRLQAMNRQLPEIEKRLKALEEMMSNLKI